MSLRLPALAACLLFLGATAFVPTSAQVPLRSGLCGDPGMGDEMCIANVGTCEPSGALCRIGFGGAGPSWGPSAPASPVLAAGPAAAGPAAGPNGEGGPCDGGVSTSGDRVVVCGHVVPVEECEVEARSDPPRVCGIPVPRDPCTAGNPACDVLERCLGNARLAATASAEAGADRGDVSVCGVSPPPVGPVPPPPPIPGIVKDCLGTAGSAKLAKASYGALSVCGTEVDPCAVVSFCGLDCLKKAGGASYATAEPPESVTVCGVTIPRPCPEGVQTSPLRLCGIPFDPCQGRLCENECARLILEGLAVNAFAASYQKNPKPALQAQVAQPPSEVCGVPLDRQCQLANPLNVPGAVGSSLIGLGPFSTRHFLRAHEGYFHAAEVDEVDCIVEDCTPSGPGYYKNLDCPCPAPPSFPVLGVDTDGDRSLDVHDVDDDCDALLDTLEPKIRKTSAGGVDFDPLVYDQIYIMNPYETIGQSANTPEFRLGIKDLAISVDWDPDWPSSNGMYIDPYVHLAHTCFSAAGCPADLPMLAIPGLNVATHPHDLGPSRPSPATDHCTGTSPCVFPSTVPGPAETAGPAWPSARQSVKLPSNLLDFPDYRWIGVDGLPQLSVQIQIMDHDQPDSADDDVGTKVPVEMSFWQLAKMVGGGLNPGSLLTIEMPGDENGDSVADLKLQANLGLAVSACLVDAARQNIGGSWEIPGVATRFGGPPSPVAC